MAVEENGEILDRLPFELQPASGAIDLADAFTGYIIGLPARVLLNGLQGEPRVQR